MAYGFADALHLLVSQNLGAKKFDRIQQFTLTALVSVLIMGALLALALVFASQWVTHIFLDAEQAAIHALAESLITYIWPLFLDQQCQYYFVLLSHSRSSTTSLSNHCFIQKSLFT